MPDIQGVTDAIQWAPNVARIAAAATTNATLVKAGPGNLYGFILTNNTGVVKSVKFYDTAGVPVPGTTPVKFTIIVPSTGVYEIVDFGIPFQTGIAYAITNLVADSDTTVVGVNDVHGCLLWK